MTQPQENTPRPTSSERFVSPYPPPEGFAREASTILTEECAEVIQRPTQTLRFGLAEVEPGQAWTNSARIGFAVGDLYATLDLAVKHKLIPPGAIAEGMAAKEKRLRRFIQSEPTSRP